MVYVLPAMAKKLIMKMFLIITAQVCLEGLWQVKKQKLKQICKLSCSAQCHTFIIIS